VVRAFEGDLGLDVTVLSGPVSGDPDDTWYGLYRYKMKADQYSYTVSDGRIYRLDDLYWRGDWVDFYNGENDPEILKSMMLAESATEAIALAFMNGHFPQPSVLNAAPVISVSQRVNGFERARTYTFSQDLPNQVKGPCQCMVEVDTVLGSVVSYRSTYFPV
jgi:hypothetical protein